MGLLRTFEFIINHPLNRRHRLRAFGRYVRWQFSSLLAPGLIAVPFVEESRFLATFGMTGLTGNIYGGLHEFEDMAFLLHALRPEDLFVDIGANVGSYTILASKNAGAETVSIEPVPSTFEQLLDNINLNRLSEKVIALNIAVGQKSGRLRFTTSLDTVNHVVPENSEEKATIEVPVQRLDDVLKEKSPFLMKIDVEGFETEVLRGAEETLSRGTLQAIIMEVNGSGARYGYDDMALHKQLLERGFSSYTYQPFTRTLTKLELKGLHQGNILYIRDLDLISKRLKSARAYSIVGEQV